MKNMHTVFPFSKYSTAGILSLTMCASAISSGNAGLFAGAEGQNNEPSYSSPKETTDGSHSLPESSDITEEPEIPLKPIFHSDVTTAPETKTTAGTTKTSDSSKAEDSVYSAIKEFAKCALKVLKNLFKGFFG